MKKEDKRKIASQLAIMPANQRAAFVANIVQKNKKQTTIENNNITEDKIPDLYIINDLVIASIAADNGISPQMVLHELNYSPYNPERNPEVKHPSEMEYTDDTEFKANKPKDNYEHTKADDNFKENLLRKVEKISNSVSELEDEKLITKDTDSKTQLLKLLKKIEKK